MYMWIIQHGIVQTKHFPFLPLCVPVIHPSFFLCQQHTFSVPFMRIPFVPMFPLFAWHAPILAKTSSKHAPCVLVMNPQLFFTPSSSPVCWTWQMSGDLQSFAPPGLQIKATPTSRQSINQFTPRAPDQPINQTVSQQMLSSLREGAGSGMVELVTPTQAERSQVSGRKVENYFMVEPGCVCTFSHQFSLVYVSLGLK